MKSCYDHLLSKQTEHTPYYSQVEDNAVDQDKKNITDILNKALKKEIITKDEYSVMVSDDKTPGRFYCNFKVHKQHEHIPPPRPLTSGSGSITEDIGTFVEYQAANHDPLDEVLLKRGRTSPTQLQVHLSSCSSSPIRACEER